MSATREAFADAIAPLPDYRRAKAWLYVSQLERALVAYMAKEELTPEQKDVCRIIWDRRPPGIGE